MAKKYDDSSISSLKGADRIRKRVGVMLGSNDIQGTQHAVFEIISNSIDEARSGYGDIINITIGKDNSIEIEDFGRGVPMDYNKAEDRYNWELIFCEMYSGSKYSNDSYDFSLGINGLGTFAAQASSEWFKVESRRDGKIFKMSFEKGEPVGKLIKEKDTTKPQKTGTKQTFKPDLEVFTDVNIDKEWYLQMLKEQAIVNAGLTFNFIDKRDGTKEKIVYPEGILGYAKELAGEETLTDALNFNFEGAGKDRTDKPNYKVKGEVVILFGNKNTDSLYFHNSSPLSYGGSPRRAKEKALMEFFKQEIKKTDSNRAKELEFDDIQDSMIFISNTFSTETSYENQTKKAINNKFIEDFLTQQITKNLKEWAKENPMELERVTNQVSINIQSRKSANAQKLATKQKLTSKIKLDDKIKNFVDCRSKDSSERELFIAEGLSAQGSLKSARNAEFQALLPIRGKLLNTLKTDYSTIFKNELIMDIMKLVGTGVEMKAGKNNKFGNFDYSNLRFNKIIIAADSDVDGKHIESLLVTMFYRLTPELIKNNHIYILQTPLFEIEYSGDKQKYFAYTEEEMLIMTKDKKCKIGRNKGLGEIDAEDFAQFMHPDSRHLKLVTMDEGKEAKEMLELFMGTDSNDRKVYITEHSTEYDDLDLE